jgi:hypothetical protein
MAAIAPPEEGKMLSEALSTVKIQVQQMKRYLVRTPIGTCGHFVILIIGHM